MIINLSLLFILSHKYTHTYQYVYNEWKPIIEIIFFKFLNVGEVKVRNCNGHLVHFCHFEHSFNLKKKILMKQI